MALKGELFNQDMVRALLDGRKKHTARPVKRKYDNTHFEYRTDKYGTEFVEMQNDVEGETFGKNSDGTTWRKLRGYIVPKPKYQPGDYMYVRETFFREECTPECAGKTDENECPFNRVGDRCYGYKAQFIAGESKEIKWHPSIHMLREAARLFFRVTKVEVMRLEDADEQFAREDGFQPDMGYSAEEQIYYPVKTAGEKFKEFWTNQYGTDAKWMWVYWMVPVSKEEALNAVA